MQMLSHEDVQKRRQSEKFCMLKGHSTMNGMDPNNGSMNQHFSVVSFMIMTSSNCDCVSV